MTTLITILNKTYNMYNSFNKRTKIKDIELRTNMNRLDFYLKAMSIFQKDKSIGGFYDSFKDKAIRGVKELENYLNKPQK